jgi:hypothetical protein
VLPETPGPDLILYEFIEPEIFGISDTEH